jgi:hypothetical protein
VTVTPLNEAHVSLLRSGARSDRRLRLDLMTYEDYRRMGITRAAIDRAVNIMAERREVELVPTPCGVLVRPLEPEQ